MVGKTKAKSTPESDSTGRTNYIRDLKGKVRKCVGSICFSTGDDGEINVDIDKSKEPECAELVAEYLLSKKQVRFNLGDEQPVRNDRARVKELEKQLEDLQSK